MTNVGCSPIVSAEHHFEPGQTAYAIEWQGTIPRLFAGQIVALGTRTLTLHVPDGTRQGFHHCVSVGDAYHDPNHAIDGELQWLRWCLPHEAIFDPPAAVRRGRQIKSLVELQNQLRLLGESAVIGTHPPRFVAA